jgi:hypothetical protein
MCHDHALPTPVSSTLFTSLKYFELYIYMIALAVSSVFYSELKSNYCVRYICLSLNPSIFILWHMSRLGGHIKIVFLLVFFHNNNSDHVCNVTPSLPGFPYIKREIIFLNVFSRMTFYLWNMCSALLGTCGSYVVMIITLRGRQSGLNRRRCGDSYLSLNSLTDSGATTVTCPQQTLYWSVKQKLWNWWLVYRLQEF